MSQCPSLEQFRKLLANELSPPAAEILELHVEGCARCQHTLSNLAGNTYFQNESGSGTANTGNSLPSFSSSSAPTLGVAGEAFLNQLEKHPPDGAWPVAEPGGAAEPKTVPGTEQSSTAGWTGPQAVAGYEILGRLGRGGMGAVYKAWQLKLNRVVAVKMVRAGVDARPEELARFRVEIEAVARLQHPNVIQIYEVGEQEGLPFFAMEYADGGSLARQFLGTPLPVHRAAQLTEVLARAIHYAHQRGVVHRDLTPGNVLLMADGTPKITDFGLAKILIGGGETQTLSGAVMGTPSYMPPEQAGGRTREVGPAIDVYALGAILYEMLTGRPPFRAESALETARQVVSEEPVPPRRLQPALPLDLETICLKCLQKEPRKRYASARELADDLQRFLLDKPIAARRTRTLERTWRWFRRQPAVAALAVSVAVLLVAITLLSSLTALWLRQERDAALAVIRHRLGQYSQAIEAFERGLQNDNGQANGHALFFLAICHHHLGDAAKADDCYRRAVQWLEDQQGRLSPGEAQRLSALRAQAEAVLDIEPKK